MGEAVVGTRTTTGGEQEDEEDERAASHAKGIDRARARLETWPRRSFFLQFERLSDGTAGRCPALVRTISPRW